MPQGSRRVARVNACVTLFAGYFLCMAVSASSQSIEGRWAGLGKTLDNDEQEKLILDLKQNGDHLAGKLTTMVWTVEVIGTISDNHFKLYDAESGKQQIATGDIADERLRFVDFADERWTAHRATSADELPKVPYLEPPPLHSVPTNGLVLTPPMGWNSWNLFANKIDDATVRTIADAIVSSGMRDAGYKYVNIDDTWEGVRDPQGNLQSNSKFPDMKALAEYVHLKGLKLGIYSSPGPRTCAGYPASYGHEEQDAKTFAGWGIDFLKYDWCSAGSIYKEEQLQPVYQKMGAALAATGRPIVYSLCEYGLGSVEKWGLAVGGNLWRTTGDIADSWESMIGNVEAQVPTTPYAGPGHWNDPDMLEIGNGHMTNDEYRTHFSLWALTAAPLLAGNDIRNMTEETKAIILNSEVIAIDQDPLGKQASPTKSGNLETWIKPLADGGVAVGIVNLGSNPERATVDDRDLHFAGPVRQARNLWTHRGVKLSHGTYSTMLAPHATLLLRINVKRRP
jgi:alpha-galactosidase